MRIQLLTQFADLGSLTVSAYIILSAGPSHRPNSIQGLFMIQNEMSENLCLSSTARTIEAL